jgi:hypothetical protein
VLEVVGDVDALPVRSGQREVRPGALEFRMKKEMRVMKRDASLGVDLSDADKAQPTR